MHTLLDPSILFFIFGIAAGLLKSNLEIPPAISRFLSLYLLMALGLKGGFALAASGITGAVSASLFAAILLAVVIPLLDFEILRRMMPSLDAISVAATYGSVSAVTFITTTQYLENQGIVFGGHMAASMALMESPAIIIAVLMANKIRMANTAGSAMVSGNGQLSLTGGGMPSMPLGKLLHESFTDGAQLLLLGAMLIGIITGEAGQQMMHPFSVDLFKGMLAFFLLDMGMQVAKNWPSLRQQSALVIVYAIIAPLVHALLALVLAHTLGLEVGNTILLVVLASSASYIAVPAVIRYAIPEASPSLYLGLSLGVTFPLNLLFGIPFYVWLVTSLA
ncbi:sodium-dependent bicarbonate transport family permease [Leeia sp. TBRC 13508]|uniref:Sodium-dependent bicarbonate transport family permease n=1 Tax=Leeia speluncae TaxID=2884804 RepID=A0ABS8D4P4_9NEIS|nr:sodium-dependent bicarbonate transport family permease [Leeia speluncae]MCB6183141.1 sodium-dependent bicarbonate transport family permease [Leeia speluncae]